MAATCTITQETSKRKPGRIQRVRWLWRAHTDGVVTAVGQSQAISGILKQCVCHEITDVSSADTLPTSGYDVTLIDKYGKDWLFGLGANMPNSNANGLCTFPVVQSGENPVLHATSLAPGITNAGSSTQGTVDLLFQEI